MSKSVLSDFFLEEKEALMFDGESMYGVLFQLVFGPFFCIQMSVTISVIMHPEFNLKSRQLYQFVFVWAYFMKHRSK